MRIKIFTGSPECLEKVINEWLEKVKPSIHKVTQSEFTGPYVSEGAMITFYYWEADDE